MILFFSVCDHNFKLEAVQKIEILEKNKLKKKDFIKIAIK